MSLEVSDNPPKLERSSDKRGCGCGTMFLVLLVLGAFGWLILYFEQGFRDRSEMRENLHRMNVGRWADCPSKVKILRVFSGSASHYYKLSIPPKEVEQFLAALQFQEGPPKVVHGGFPGSGDINESWWRPQDEKELLLTERRVDNSSGGWTSWYAVASRDTGHVYICRVGH